MALSIAVGFVVDDAIVMVEVIWQHLEKGEKPFEAALKGSGEVGFTILSISISLVAVFTPLMFMGGVVGLLMREFAVTLSAAVVISMILTLTFTPMLCSLFLKPPEAAEQPRSPRRFDHGFKWLDDALWAGAGQGAGAQADHPDGVHRHRGAGRLFLRHRQDRLLPAAGHRLPVSGVMLTSQDCLLHQGQGQDHGGRHDASPPIPTWPASACSSATAAPTRPTCSSP